MIEPASSDELDTAYQKIYYWDENYSRWMYIGGEYDSSTGYIVADIHHFTSFATFTDVQSPEKPTVAVQNEEKELSSIITGMAEPGSVVEIYANGELKGQAEADLVTGIFVVKSTVTTGEAWAFTRDPAGNVSTGLSFTIGPYGAVMVPWAGQELKIINAPNPFNPSNSR